MNSIYVHVNQNDVVIINYFKKNNYTYNPSFPIIQLRNMKYVNAYPCKPTDDAVILNKEQFIALINLECKQKYSSWVGRDVICIKAFLNIKVGDVRKIKEFVLDSERGPRFNITEFGVASLFNDYYLFDEYWKISETQPEYKVGDYIYVLKDIELLSSTAKACTGSVLKIKSVGGDHVATDWGNSKTTCGGIYKNEIRPATTEEINRIYRPEIQPKYKEGDKILFDQTRKGVIDHVVGRFEGKIYYKIGSEHYQHYSEDQISSTSNFKPGDKLIGKSISGQNITSTGNPLGKNDVYFVADEIEYSNDGTFKLWSKGSYWNCNIKDIMLYVEPVVTVVESKDDHKFKLGSIWKITDPGSEMGNIIKIIKLESSRAFYQKVDDSTFQSNFHVNSSFARSLIEQPTESKLEHHFKLDSVWKITDNGWSHDAESGTIVKITNIINDYIYYKRISNPQNFASNFKVGSPFSKRLVSHVEEVSPPQSTISIVKQQDVQRSEFKVGCWYRWKTKRIGDTPSTTLVYVRFLGLEEGTHSIWYSEIISSLGVHEYRKAKCRDDEFVEASFSEVEPYINRVPSTSDNPYVPLTFGNTELISKDEDVIFIMSEVEPVKTVNKTLLT